jgi:hypothetical protein
MKLTERIRKVDQMGITLLAVFVSTVLSFGVFISYIYQGLTDISIRNADDYYGGYINSNGDGSLLMDILIVVLFATVLVTVVLALKKRQSRYLLFAIIIFLVSTPISQSYTICLANLVICIFGFVYLKRDEQDSQHGPNKAYLMTVVCTLYFLDAISCVVFLTNYVVNIIPKSASPDLSSNLSFKGDVPDWAYWGIEPPNTSVSTFDLIISVIPFILILIAVVCMFCAIRGRGRNRSRLGAAAFLLYLLYVMILYGELYSFIFAMAMPEALLSIYILIHREPLEEK